VRQDETGTSLCHDRGHPRITTETANIIDKVCPLPQHRRRNVGLIRVYGDGNRKLFDKALQEWKDPAKLLFCRDRLRTRSRRLSAHINKICSLFDYPMSVLDRPTAVEIQSPVRKRIGGHVEDPHDLCPGRQIKAESPAPERGQPIARKLNCLRRVPR
jgi:hypothetical protein